MASKLKGLKNLKGGVLSLIMLFNMVLSMLSQIAISSKFGSSFITDGYFIALTVPMFLSNLFACISIPVIVPSLTNCKATYGENAVIESVNYLLTLIVVFLLGVTISVILFKNDLISLLFPGLPVKQKALVLSLLPILMVSNSLMCLSSFFIAILNTNKMFILPVLSLCLNPLLIILSTVFFSKSSGIYSVAYGYFLGVTLQLIQLILLCEYKNKIRFTLNLKNNTIENVKKIGLPLLFSSTILQTIPLIERHFASNFNEGTIFYMATANRLSNAIAMLLISGYATIYFPYITAKVADGKIETALKQFEQILVNIFGVALPVLLYCPYYSIYLTNMIYKHGAFTSNDAQFVSTYFNYYICANIFAAVSTLVVFRTYYALKNKSNLTNYSIITSIIIYTSYLFLRRSEIKVTDLINAYTLFWITSFTITLISILFIFRKFDVTSLLKKISEYLLIFGIISSGVYIHSKCTSNFGVLHICLYASIYYFITMKKIFCQPDVNQ